MSHPRHDFDSELLSAVRFSLIAALAGGERVEFRFLKDTLGVSDSALSKQITRLEEAEMLEVHKGYVGKRPRTWVEITKGGSRRYDQHVAALRAVINQPPMSVTKA